MRMDVVPPRSGKSRLLLGWRSAEADRTAALRLVMFRRQAKILCHRVGAIRRPPSPQVKVNPAVSGLPYGGWAFCPRAKAAAVLGMPCSVIDVAAAFSNSAYPNILPGLF